MLLSCLVTSAPLFVGACTSDAENEDDSSVFEIDDGANEGAFAGATATPDKETVLSLKTGAQVAVPAGAVSGNIDLGLKRASDAQAKELVQTVSSKDKVVSAPYVLTPHGTKFMKDVQVTLPINKAANPDNLVVIYLEDEKDKSWESLGKAQVSGAKSATIKVKHFSVLLLVESETVGGGVEAPDAMRDASTAEPRPMIGMDAGTQQPKADAGEPLDTLPDAGQPEADAGECKRDSCAVALAKAGVQCGEVDDGCGSTRYCYDVCGSGNFCDGEARECKPSACGTSCDALPVWDSYCNHEGHGAWCFPSALATDPAWICDESSASCREAGVCMACNGKCIDNVGCDPDTVSVIGAEGGSFEEQFAGAVIVPPGSAAEDTEFRIVRDPDWAGAFAPNYPAPYALSGGAHCIGPYATTFAEAITLVLRYRSSQTSVGMAVFKLDDPQDTSWTVESSASIESLPDDEYAATIMTHSLGCFGLGIDI